MVRFIKMMIKSHKKRSIAIILGISCSVAMMFCLVQMGDSIIEQYKKIAAGFAYWDIRIGNLTREQAVEINEKVLKLGVKAVSTGYRVEEYIEIDGIWPVKFIGYGGTDDLFNATGFELLKGKFPQNDKEVCVEEYSCERLGLSIGDEIVVKTQDALVEHVLTISGMIENTDMLKKSDLTFGTCLFSIDFMEKHKDFMTDEGCYVELVTIEKEGLSDNIVDIRKKCMEIFSELYSVDHDLVSRKVLNGIEVTENEKEVVKCAGDSVTYNDDKIKAYTELSNRSEVGQALRMLVILIAIAMVLLIFNNMHLNIAENTRELGMLRCIGMDSIQTGILIFAENFIYCLLGYGIGVILGNFINNLFANKIMFWLCSENVILTQTSDTYFYIAVVEILSMILAFVLSMQKIIGLKPLEASKYTGIGSEKIRKRKCMEKWSVKEFAIRNIQRKRVNSLVVIITMTFSMIILMLIVNTMLSIKLPQKNRKSQFSDYEVYVSLQGILDSLAGEASDVEIKPENLESILHVHGVDKVFAMGIGTDMKKNLTQKEDTSVVTYKIYNDEMMEWFLKENGKNQLWQEGISSICVITGAYDETDEKVLKEIEEKGIISYEMNSGKKGDLVVNTIIYSDYEPEQKDMKSSPFVVILSEECAFKMFDTFGYTDVMIDFNKEADEETKKDIAGIFKENEYVLCGSYDIGMERVLQTTLYMVFIAVFVVVAMMVTSVLNMVIIMKANLVFRRKEYGIWRALGMPLTELKKTIHVEVLILLLTSYVIAVVVSLPIQFYLCIGMGNINIKHMLYGYSGVGISIILVVYLLVICNLKFKESNRIIDDIREVE